MRKGWLRVRIGRLRGEERLAECEARLAEGRLAEE